MSLAFSTEKKYDIQLFIPSILEFSLPNSFTLRKDYRLYGDFPRRVEQYEPLIDVHGFLLRSPLAGVVSLKDSKDSKKPIFELKVSGKNILRHLDHDVNPTRKIENTSQWISFLNSYGLYSFEYEQPLSFLFQNEKLTEVFFLLKDPYYPEFWFHIMKQHLDELIEFKDVLKKIYSNISIEFLPDLNSLKKQNEFSKDYKFHFKYLQHNKSINTLVFGPSTLYSIIRALYFSEPFVKNFLFVKNYETNETKIKLCYHGTPLKDLDLQVDTLSNFSINRKINVLEEYYDVFTDYYYFFRKSKNRQLCIACFLCNDYCPVNANPMGLWENIKYFKIQNCIRCGLCEEVCLSNLPLMIKINELFS
ncbi:MAG: hypothetical protein NZ853_08885 [Leptospiraceae bacterium]|nr:hypothetical protein [Leptospiraceae bacterium]MDW7975543.1 hypothetical protein [Leptospiraceae bacterium]